MIDCCEIPSEHERSVCANCKETGHICACFRNTCMKCHRPVGNITFTVCDQCWDKEHKTGLNKE